MLGRQSTVGAWAHHDGVLAARADGDDRHARWIFGDRYPRRVDAVVDQACDEGAADIVVPYTADERDRSPEASGGHCLVGPLASRVGEVAVGGHRLPHGR